MRYVTRKQVRGAVEAAGHSWGGAWVVRVLDLDPELLTLSDTPPPEAIDEPLPPGPGVEVVHGVEIMPGEKAPKQPHPEGGRQQVLVNRYERDPKARSKCIRHHRPICQVCDADFEKLYGRFAKGFIHVHHLHPLGKAGGVHEIDPIKDLVPVCPNCHAVIHVPKGKPPFTIQQVRRFIRLHRPRA